MMNVFFKDKKKSFFERHREINRDTRVLQDTLNYDATLPYCLGIDGSTTSFGVSWYTETKENDSLLMLMRDESENASSFMEEVFPFLQSLFYRTTFRITTYERTPDDFVTDNRMTRVMKQTEASVKNFLETPYYVNVSHPDHIFDIFPISWKSYMVPSDIMVNPGKVNKRENAVAILSKRGHDVSYWLKELDALPGHSYDCVEALGIGLYGSEFIYAEPFIRTFRNFSRRRPLTLIGVLVSEEAVADEIETLFSALGKIPMCLYSPNDYHSAFENLYALDNDKKVGLLITENDSPTRVYLEHIHGLYDKTKTNVLLSFTMRHNRKCESILNRLSGVSGYSIVEI